MYNDILWAVYSNIQYYVNVVYQNIVVDRLKDTSLSVLPIVAIDMNWFAAVVHEISTHLANDTQRDRLNIALAKLIHFDVISAVNATCYEGRKNRINSCMISKYLWMIFIHFLLCIKEERKCRKVFTNYFWKG